MTNFAAIPTTFKGVTYRSRLEAKWACTFDLLGWAFEYEPFDLNGWIPDFALLWNEPLLIEIKPFLKLDDQWLAVEQKISSALPPHEVLILGAIPTFSMGLSGPTVGRLRETEDTYGGSDPDGWTHGELTCCPKCLLSVTSNEGSWHCRQCGACSRWNILDAEDIGVFRNMFTYAGTVTQWKSKAVHA
jgi:hypothetical protein